MWTKNKRGKVNYLDEATKKYANSLHATHDLALFVAQAQAAATIALVEELKELNSRTGRLAYIGACLADLAGEMEES